MTVSIFIAFAPKTFLVVSKVSFLMLSVKQAHDVSLSNNVRRGNGFLVDMLAMERGRLSVIQAPGFSGCRAIYFSNLIT